MKQARSIPEDLAEMAPGPGLAVALAGVDLPAMSSLEVIATLRAEYRQLAHQQARVFAAMAEAGLRWPDDEDGVVRLEEPDEFSADEVRAALVLTAQAAGRQLRIAEAHRVRLARVQAEMLAGRVDRQRAWVFFEYTGGLCQEHVDVICAALLPRCGELTVPELIDRIRKMTIALDPGLVERRFERSRRARRLVGNLEPDGTATLTNYGLEPDVSAAIHGRLDGLARSAKNGGDPRPIDHLRADLSAWLQDGRFEGMTDNEILAYLAAHRPEPPAPEAATHPDTGGAEEGQSAERAEDGGPRFREPWEPPRAGVELQVRLSTLLGMDEFPAALAGWGPIHPGLARSVAADLGTAQWRYVLTGPDGRLLTQGLTRARPTGVPRRHHRSCAILELQIPATLLLDLVTGEPSHGADADLVRTWMPVLRDIVNRIGGLPVLTGQRPHAPPEDGTDDPRRRFARAGLRRDVQQRKRRCMGVGCRAPAGRLDLDHTLDHALGGPTAGFNLWPGCKHDHALKTKGGWTVRAIDADTLQWTSRLGCTYVVKTPPVIDTDLPDPAPDPDAEIFDEPDPDPDFDAAGKPWQESSSWCEPAPPSPRRRYIELDDDPPPPPRPRYVVPDDPPF